MEVNIKKLVKSVDLAVISSTRETIIIWLLPFYFNWKSFFEVAYGINYN